ncbi:MAG: cation transporter [Actinobacteria bacterium]|nr:cation transporter [Actinomycetota bacterium]
MHEGSRKAVLAALIANFGIAVSKLVGFLLTGAASMLAEAIHSFADCGNQSLLLLGSRLASREAGEDRPFGYGRERYFWAFVVALVLFSLGGLFAVYEGISKLRDPHELDSPVIAIGILAVAIGLETMSLRTALREAHDARGEGSLWQFIRHAKSPELPVVLLEDIGAELGLLLAVAGVVTAEVTANPRWDAMGSLGIGILLVVIAGILATEMKSLLIGESASPADRDAIKHAVENAPAVRSLIHLRTLHLGPEELLVAGKLELDARLTFAEVAAAINAAEDRLRQAVPSAHVVYLEPDIHRTPESGGPLSPGVEVTPPTP